MRIIILLNGVLGGWNEASSAFAGPACIVLLGNSALIRVPGQNSGTVTSTIIYAIVMNISSSEEASSEMQEMADQFEPADSAVAQS